MKWIIFTSEHLVTKTVNSTVRERLGMFFGHNISNVDHTNDVNNSYDGVNDSDVIFLFDERAQLSDQFDG